MPAIVSIRDVVKEYNLGKVVVPVPGILVEKLVEGQSSVVRMTNTARPILWGGVAECGGETNLQWAQERE